MWTYTLSHPLLCYAHGEAYVSFKLLAFSRDLLMFGFKVQDIRCSENPATDPNRGGVGRFALIARLAKVKMLNGSEVNSRAYAVYCHL